MKILICEDEDAVRELCVRALKKIGFAPVAVDSADQAVSRLGEGWDIVLTDLSMPGKLGGMDLLRLVRAESGSTDVIIMTAFPEVETVIKALQEGAYDYLVKPLNMEKLALAIQRCASKRQLSAELAREKALRAELERTHAELEKMNRVKAAFGQFVTPEVAQFVMAHLDDFWRRGSRQVISVLFTDVRQFTRFASSVPPEDAVSAVNEVFARIVDAVLREGGTPNKFIGDGVLALFGAPIVRTDHALAAARAALQARDAVEKLAKEREAKGQVALRIGIGINTGEVVAGCLGTKDRAEYSVIGHCVNLASRIEHEASAGQVLLGPDTASALPPGMFKVGGCRAMTLNGVAEPIMVTELLSSI